MPDLIKPKYQPSADYPYFVCDPSDDGFMYFSSEVSRDAWGKAVIENHLDEGWSEEVTDVIAGKITHATEMTNKVERPDCLDEDNCDAEGIHWDPEWDYTCNYELTSITKNAITPTFREGMCDDPDCVGCDPMPLNATN